MSHVVELPSLEEIEEMDKQRSNATESLAIINDHVRCQGCGNLQPVIKDDSRLTTSGYSGRIIRLQTMIKQAEKYQVGRGSSTSTISCKKEKEELAFLLEEVKKKDFLRRLPLYSCKITGYRWVCICYDEAYYLSSRKKE